MLLQITLLLYITFIPSSFKLCFILAIYNFCWNFPFFFLFLFHYTSWSPVVWFALPHSDLPQDLCPVYRPGEWEQLPSEWDLNPFSRYEAMDPKRTIILDDIESTLTETGKMSSNFVCILIQNVSK